MTLHILGELFAVAGLFAAVLGGLLFCIAVIGTWLIARDLEVTRE